MSHVHKKALKKEKMQCVLISAFKLIVLTQYVGQAVGIPFSYTYLSWIAKIDKKLSRKGCSSIYFKCSDTVRVTKGCIPTKNLDAVPDLH